MIALGPGKLLKDGKRSGFSVKIADEVLYGKYSGTEVKIEDKEFVIMRESDLLGIIQD